MSSKREQVLEGVKAMWAAALPFADVQRNREKPERASPGGDVDIEDGDPGEPEVDLSPLSYNFAHRIPCLVTPPPDAADPAAALDDMLVAMGAAVDADPFLGGLCQFLSTEAPNTDEIEAYGVPASRSALVMVVAEYSTLNPLT